MTRYAPLVKEFNGCAEWCIYDSDTDAYAFFDTPETDDKGREYMEEIINAALSLPRYVWHKQVEPAGYWAIVDKTQEKEKPMTLRERAMKAKVDIDAEAAEKQAKHRAEVTANMKKEAQEIVKERLETEISQEAIEVVFDDTGGIVYTTFEIDNIPFKFFWDYGKRILASERTRIRDLYDLGEYLESMKESKS